MKVPHILTICLSAASLAAVCLLTPLSAKTKEASAAPTPPSEEEAQELYQKAAAFLRETVEVESDDVASAHFVYRGRYTRIEWRNLIFRQLILGSVSEKDRRAGVSRRMYAQLGCEGHRLIDENGTTEWRSGHFQSFPTFVLIEEVAGSLRISAPGIDQFARSPGRLTDHPALHQEGDETLVAKRF